MLLTAPAFAADAIRRRRQEAATVVPLPKRAEV
jgi:hypothetical protein